jgi:hypothetical protein
MGLEIIILREITQTPKTNMACFLSCVESRFVFFKDMKVEVGPFRKRKRISKREEEEDKRVVRSEYDQSTLNAYTHV